MPTLVQPSLSNLQNLQILGVGGAVLAEYALIAVGRLSFERNRRGYQAFENDNQVASGDGRRVVGERTVDVLIQATEGDPHRQLYELDLALEDAVGLSYEGVSVTLAGVRGVTSAQPIGVGSRNLRATITYLPETATALDSSGQAVLGPI